MAATEHTFLFADLAGFTALTEVHGDEEAADLAGEFAATIRAMLPEYGAEEVKCIGDAVMIRCPDASRAVRLGVRMVAELGSRPGLPSVRVGMNTGPAVERDGDWFGAAVNLAARVSGAAVGGEVLLTEETRLAAGRVGSIELLPRGRRELEERRRARAALRRGGGRRPLRGGPADRPGLPHGRRPGALGRHAPASGSPLLLLLPRLRRRLRHRASPLRG